MIDLGHIPAWCLYPILEKMEPEKIAEIAPVNKDLSEACLSQTLWEDKYNKKFNQLTYHISKSPMNVDWLESYAKRNSVSFNIENHKPKAKSFKGTEINQIHSYSNSFAFSGKDNLSIYAYDYLENGCEYESIKSIPFKSNDFLYVDQNTIVSVADEVLSMINVKTGQIAEITKGIGKNPLMHAISPKMFVVVTESRGYVFDTTDITSPRSDFKHIGKPIALGSNNYHLYIATSKDLMCIDVYNPRAPIIWSFSERDDVNVTHCSFNYKAGIAIYGNQAIKLISGRNLFTFDEQNISTSAILNNGIAVLGTMTEGVIYYDINKKLKLGTQLFGDDEKIRFIYHNDLNDKVVIAGDFNVHIVAPHYEKEEFVISEVRSPLKCGSVRMRMIENFGILKQIIFDGERIIANMGDFVRVYDFYTGKLAEITPN